MSLPTMYTFALLFAFAFATHAAITPFLSQSPSNAHIIRVLKAASDSSVIRRRADNLELSRHAKLIYTDVTNINLAGPNFVSTVQLQSSKPILVLEELEHHLELVQCIHSDDETHVIDIKFKSEHVCSGASLAWGNLDEFFLVTSHASCNADGDREIFRVTTLGTGSERSIRLKMQRNNWQDAMTSMKVDFGISHGRELRVRRHRNKRNSLNQQTTTTVTQKTASVTPLAQSTLPTNSSLAATSSTLGFFGWPMPSSSPNKSLEQPFHLDISYQKLAQNIQVPYLPQISFGCKNCSTNGSLEILTGSFDIALQNTLTPMNIIQNGTVMLSMPDGFNAYIELGLNVSANAQFKVPIIDVPIQGFTIPNIGKAGLYFSPVVNVNLQSNQAVQMGFGFEVNIPRNSSMELDVSAFSNLTKSIIGFNETQVKALPASLNASITGALTTSFQPNIVFGFELAPREVITQSDEINLGAQVAAVFDAPALTFNLSREAQTNLSCAMGTNNMTSVVSSEVSFGMGIEAGIYAPGIPSDDNGVITIAGIPIMLPATSISILSTTVAATSTCVGVVQAGQTEGPVVVTSATPSPTSTSTSTSSSTTSSGSFGVAPTQPPKTPTGDACILVANVCAVLLTMTAMIFMSL